MEFIKTETNRGFQLIQFHDDYDKLCDIQESSSIKPHIWLGMHEAEHKILASKVFVGGTGWTDYYIPDDVSVFHRMYLNKKQCISLALRLLRFGLFEKL